MGDVSFSFKFHGSASTYHTQLMAIREIFLI